MWEYLSGPEKQELAAAIVGMVGYGPAERTAIIADLPLWLRGRMPGGQAAPLVGALLDLGFLNTIPRLSDGSVPLKQFLNTLLFLVGSNVMADPIRRKLSEIDAAATGAPPVSSSPPQESQEKYVTRTAMVGRSFLAGGLDAARSVAKLSVARVENDAFVQVGDDKVVYVGTGWLIARNVMITNYHVINARNQGEPQASPDDFKKQLAGTVVRFDFDDEALAGIEIHAGVLLAADSGFDYALFRIDAPSREPLRRAAEPIREVDPANAVAVNIIQHPDGKAKKWGVRNNLVSAATDSELRYFTDTLGGSSGSPVLNDDWEVVALHRGSKFVSGVQFQGRSVAYVNVGTQLGAIIADLKERYTGLLPEMGI